MSELATVAFKLSHPHTFTDAGSRANSRVDVFPQ